ncbi:hypothetical protein [Spirosoma litoris]
MAKTFTVINSAGVITAKVGDKTTVVNASASNAFLTDDAIDTALASLPYEAKQAVLNSLYSLAPGASKALSAGSYNLSFAMGFGSSAVLVVENNS